eukprot:3771963-Rhodomonas_salina.1
MAGIPLKVHCCGSFRRGKADTGDIDMVLEASGDLGYEYSPQHQCFRARGDGCVEASAFQDELEQECVVEIAVWACAVAFRY